MTGPVHAVLANADLLSMIFPAKACYYEREELFRLALVCRKFCAVALDILWKRVEDMDHIYCLFPRHIVYKLPGKTMSFSRTPVTRDEWARFETYAWRIRKIRVFFAEDHVLYMVLGRHPSRRHPFAHLTSLRWFGDVSSVSHVTSVICSTLADISFHLHGDGPDDVMADIIQAVKETCTHLRKFEYSRDGGTIPTSSAFETCLVSLISSSTYLRKISVPTNCLVLDALALLPSLTRLSLGHPLESGQNGWNVTHSAGPQSPDQTFVPLELLKIWSTFTSIGSFHLVLERFRKIASKPRVHLKVRVDSQDPHLIAELPRHLYDALPPNIRIALDEFHIYQNWGAEVVAPWQSFSWLLASPHLQALDLRSHSLEIDDAAFAEIAQKWPELRTLHLVICHGSLDPHTTFCGLAHLSLLPELQDLFLTIGPNCTILPSLLYSKKGSTSPLRELRLRGKFPNADTLQVALFLAKHFPNLQTFYALHPQPRPQWDEVKARVMFLCKILPEIPKGRARLIFYR